MIYNFGIFDGLYVGKNSCNKIYQLWYTMIKRCYGSKIQESYLGVTVHTDWKY